MSTNLIGTGANQVSVNGMLGTAAFRDISLATIEELETGTSSKEVTVTPSVLKTVIDYHSENIDAINASLAGTAVAVFVYDTSKDSDGGRAARNAGVPPVILITATTTTVTLYSGTDSTVPSLSSIGSLSNVTSVFALHGRLYVGSSSAGLLVYDLFNSNTLLFTYTTSSSPAIVANTVQCITATVLPTTPIGDNGLPVPTVWVGTLGGVSRIADDGTVSNWTEATSVDDVYNIAVIGDYVWWSTDNSTQGKWIHTVSKYTALTAWAYSNTTYLHYSANTIVWSSATTPIYYAGAYSITQDITHNAIATHRSLTLIQPNTTTWGNGLHCTITKDFNSGWQYGDIRGAWLCSGTAETLTAASLVTGDSSTFTGGVGSWATQGVNGGTDSSYSVVANALQITRGTGTQAGHPYLLVSTVVGVTYNLSLTVISGDPVHLRAGTSVDGLEYFSTAGLNVGTYTYSFKATSTSLYIGLWCYAVSTTTNIDNVTVKLADPDVSYKNQALEVVGNVTKSAVASGCDLMAYSGFSVNNYLTQAYRSDLDFGTGDFYVMGWVKNSNRQSIEFILDRGTGAINTGVSLFWNGSNSLVFRCLGASVATATIADSNYHLITAFRLNGVAYLYVDTTLAASGADTQNLSNISSSLFIGCRCDLSTGAGAVNTYISRIRIGAGAPSAAQIKHIYNTEKYNYQANSNCLLAGTSNDVKSAKYDESTGIHHCVTGDYYSAFKDLVRVDEESGVWTSVNAESGYVVKGA